MIAPGTIQAPVVRELLVTDLSIRSLGLAGTPRPSPREVPPIATVDAAPIRRGLPPAPRLRADALMEAVLDQSASVEEINDVARRRHQILLIALAHLSARRSPGAWHVQISTFDATSPLDLPRTRLDRQGLDHARRALSTPSSGGCSILGPALQRANTRLAAFNGPSLLVVLSDFELFDPQPVVALAALANNQASEAVAISLNREPPTVLLNSRLTTVHVCSDDAPLVLARAIVDAARRCAAGSQELAP